jgi:protein-disulfide isomerase
MDPQYMWSTYRRVAGIPLEAFALIWFVCVIACESSAWGRWSPTRSVLIRTTAVIVSGCGAGLLYVVGRQSYAVGVATVAASFIMLVVWLEAANNRSLVESLSDLRREWQTFGGRPGRLVALVACASGVAILGQYVSATARAPDPTRVRSQFIRWFLSIPQAEDRTLRGEHSVRLVLFLDYQCPRCNRFLAEYEAAISRYRTAGNTVELLVRDFPLDRDCNTAAATARHPAACEATIAVRIARRHGGDDVANALGAQLRQAAATLDIPSIEARLSTLGLLEAYRAGFDRERAIVFDEMRGAGRLGVSSTPTAVINGRVVTIASRAALESILEHELSRTGTMGMRRP